MHPCEACGSTALVVRSIPAPCREILANDPAQIAFCEDCLTLRPAPAASVDPDWDPSTTSPAFPADLEAAVGVVLLVTLLESLALNRAAIGEIVRYLETAGVDPLLVLDRLAVTPGTTPPIALADRRDQLAQIMESADR